ncbi:MAG TPA: hypothetical protein VMY37_29790 [Thermoguttaceae bacterium]|nr:hypothetical protein [Thermoguttaceae bacterium]
MGSVFQPDPCVSSGVAPESYELALGTLRESGEWGVLVVKPQAAEIADDAS